MKTINTYYKNYRDLKQFVETNSGILFANNDGAILVQVFSSICDKDFLNELSKQIIELVPHAQVLGAPTSSEIMNGMISELKTVLSFPVFQHSDIKTSFVVKNHKNDYAVGRSIATALNVDKAKVLIIFVTGLTVNSSQMLKGVQSVNIDLPVAGGNTADNFAHQIGFVACNEAITDCGVVGVALAGECLAASRDKEGRAIRFAGALFDNHDKKLKEKKVKEYLTRLQQKITERKQAEEALRTSRETLSLAAELARLGPWKYDAKTNLFEFGNEFYAVYGTDVAQEGAFMTPDVYTKEFVHPDDAWVVEAEIRKVLSSTERYYSTRMEHRIIRRDGLVRTIAVRTNIEKDADGQIVKWYGANQDITELKQAEEAIRKKTEEIQRLAYTDSLTDLPNRTYITERLEKEMEKARLGKSSGVLLFIDLDNFKMVNDAFGHTYGDALIIMAGNRIVEQVGSDAFVGRIGGDEFMAILPGKSNRQSLSPIIEGIIAALCQDIEVLGVCFHISASAGAAIYPNDGDTSEEIFKNADNAMYAAKKAGKNCWRFYEATMQAEAYEKMLLTNSLHHAIERGELLLHYQPQVSVNSGSVVGFEALLRWNSLEHGSISPLQFIPIAEQSGLIQSIGEWALREACRFARRLADQEWGHIYVAVNVSPHQLCSDLFIESVGNVLNDFGILPCRLQLEITETALISSLEESTRKLNQLQAMGVRLALDDFGTGYSSLTYLQHLPVTTLKIDKSFIEMIPVVGTRKSIIGNVVDMAHTMEMTVVAEGVETQEQFDYLARYGCDCIQGYLFSRPIPEEEAVKFLHIRFKC